MKMESLWTSIFLLLLTIAKTSAQDVNLTFLTSVPRLNLSTTRDYYFCCNAVGRFIQWEYNTEPLTGFLTGEVGRVLVNKRINYTYIATLLSSQPTDNSQAKLDSIVVISIANNIDPVNFTITCSSNLGVQSITPGATVDTVKYSNHETKEIQLDYVISGHVVSTYFTTHIFLCRVRELPQFIEVTGSALGFSIFDNVGQSRTIFSSDRSTVLVLGILIARESLQAVTLIFAVADTDVIVSCYNRENRATLPSTPVVIPYSTVGTPKQPAQSSMKNTEETTSLTTPSLSLEVKLIEWVPAVLAVGVLLIMFIFIALIALAIVYKVRQLKRTFKISKNLIKQDRNEDDCIPPFKDSSMNRMQVAQASDHKLSKSSVGEDASDHNVNREDSSNVSFVVVNQDKIYHLNHCTVIEKPSVDSPGLIIGKVAPVAKVAPVVETSKALVHFTMTNNPTAASNQFETITNHDESSSTKSDGSKVLTYPM